MHNKKEKSFFILSFIFTEGWAAVFISEELFFTFIFIL